MTTKNPVGIAHTTFQLQLLSKALRQSRVPMSSIGHRKDAFFAFFWSEKTRHL